MFTEDEHAGRKVRCPNCQGIVVVPGTRRVPAGAITARRDPDAEDDDEDDSYARREEGALSTRIRLGRARIGLGLHWGKSLCLLILAAFGLLGSLIFLIMTVAASTATGPGAADGMAAGGIVVVLLSCLGFIAFFVMPVLGAVGSLMCFWLPARSGARVLSMVACGLDAGAALFLLVLLFMSMAASASMGRGGPFSFDNTMRAGGAAMVLSFLVMVLLLSAWILHMLVLKNLATYARGFRTAADVMRMLIIGLVTVIVPGILIWVLSIMLIGPRTGRAGVFVVEFLLIAWSGGLLAVSYQVMNLTGAVRQLLDR
jgi:hypothetical protein